MGEGLIIINKIKIGFIIIVAMALIYNISTDTKSQSTIGTFQPDRTRFIDQVGDNLLYRGNIPILHKKFARTEVLASMISPSSRNTPVNPKATAPTSIPDPHLFVDFSLLNTFGEEDTAFHIEGHFFMNNSVGILIHYELHKLLMKGLILRDVGPIYDQVITDLHQQLLSTGSSPRIIYVHCKAGIDRTGAVIAGYAMRYLGYSYNEAIAINITQGISRRPDFYSTIGIKHYARYLRDTIGIKTIGKIPD